MADAPDATLLKRRARRRLVGAIALVLFVVIVLPIVLDQERQPAPPDLTVQIPSQEAGRFNTRVLPPLAASPAAGEKSEPPVAPRAESAKAAAGSKSEAAGPQPALPQAQPEVGAKDIAKESPPAPAKSAVAKAPAPKSAPAAGEAYMVPLGVFVKAENVKRVRDRAAKAGIKSYIEKIQGTKGEETRVRAGPFASREAAEKARDKLKAAGMNVGQVAQR